MSENDRHFYYINLREGYDDDQPGSGRTRKPTFSIPIIITESALAGATDTEDKRLALLVLIADSLGLGFSNGDDADISYPGLIQMSFEKVYNEYTLLNGDDSNWYFNTAGPPTFKVGELPAGQRVTSPYPRRICIYEDNQGSIVLNLDTVEPKDDTPDIKAGETSCIPVKAKINGMAQPLLVMASRLFDAIVVQAKQNEYVATR